MNELEGSVNFFSTLIVRSSVCLLVCVTAWADAPMPGDSARAYLTFVNRACDRVGNVVEFEVEEDRQPDLGQFVHAVVAVRAEEFQTQLDPADMALDLFGQGARRVDARQIEGEIDWVAHVVAGLS